MKIKNKIVSKIPEEKRIKIKKVLNVLRVIKNVVCWTMIIVLAFLVITFLLSRVSGGTPSLFGFTIQRVSSGSMEPELMVGDIILSQQVEDVSTLQVGDIITFKGGEQFQGQNVSHRIIVAPYEKDGETYLQTKGDANDVADNPISAAQVQSKMLRKVALLTVLYNFFLSPWGLLIFIALLLLVFFDELMNIVHIASGNYSEKKEESISEIIERIQREDAENAKREKEKKSRKMVDLMVDASGQPTAEGDQDDQA